MKDYSSSAPERPRPRRRARGSVGELRRRGVLDRARPAPPPPPPPPDSPRSRTGPAEVGRGLQSPAAPEGARLVLPSLASRRPCSSTRARVLLTNGPGVRRWGGRRRLLSGLTSRAAVVAAAATSLSGTADTATQSQPGLLSALLRGLPGARLAPAAG